MLFRALLVGFFLEGSHKKKKKKKLPRIFGGYVTHSTSYVNDAPHEDFFLQILRSIDQPK